jgi:hypothetical protein
MNKYPLVKVYWFDAESGNSWVDEEEIASEGLGEPVVTVGFLVRKPGKGFPAYMIASTTTQGDAPHFNNTMKIPKAWVKSVETIENVR